MSHFAQIEAIDNNLSKVIQVIVIPDSQEHRGAEYINNDLNISGTWIQCSFNTRKGVHLTGKTPLRKNFPGVGWTYDFSRDAFIPPKPSKNPSFILEEDMCIWIPPIPYPTDHYLYRWNEEKVEWEKIEKWAPFPNSWVWDKYTYQWKPPIPYPSDTSKGKQYSWDEETISWKLIIRPIPYPEDGNNYYWDEKISDWKLIKNNA